MQNIPLVKGLRARYSDGQIAIVAFGIVFALISIPAIIVMLISKPSNSGTAVTSSSATTQKKAEKNAKQTEAEEQAKAARDVAEFSKLISAIDTNGDLIRGVSVGISPDFAEITVQNSWHREPYQIRLQAAQAMWKAWAGIHSPNDPDDSRIKIVDMMGNDVGGSRVLAGSLIWVSD